MKLIDMVGKEIKFKGDPVVYEGVSYGFHAYLKNARTNQIIWNYTDLKSANWKVSPADGWAYSENVETVNGRSVCLSNV